MSWAETKIINSNFNEPLDELIKRKNFYRKEIITNSQTWVSPVSGIIYVTCVGKGGDGGSSWGAYPGGGGGAGGVAHSKYEVSEGDSFTITLDALGTSFNGWMTATNGGNGPTGIATNTASEDPPALGGTASGGNILNSDGEPGGDSEEGSGGSVTVFVDGESGGKGGLYGGDGGHGCLGPIFSKAGDGDGGGVGGKTGGGGAGPRALEYRNGGKGLYGGGDGGSTSGTVASNVGNAGSGGGGGGAYGGGGGGSAQYSNGGQGASGAVIIEYLG